jgi:hypothetical protein
MDVRGILAAATLAAFAGVSTVIQRCSCFHAKGREKEKMWKKKPSVNEGKVSTEQYCACPLYSNRSISRFFFHDAWSQRAVA